LRDATHTVKQAVFGVDVKMDILPGHQSDYSISVKCPWKRDFRAGMNFRVLRVSIGTMSRSVQVFQEIGVQVDWLLVCGKLGR
jgi:hypothetical protein